MMELGLTIGLLAVLVGGAATVSYVPWYYLFGGGAVMCVVGLVGGVPSGAIYHVVMYRLLRKSGPVPTAFWLRPTDFHVRLTDEERRRVRRWFFAGGAGFALAILGAVLVAIGAWKSD